MCDTFCGWHTYTTFQNVQYKYAYVGSADQCANNGCGNPNTVNGNSNADNM